MDLGIAGKAFVVVGGTRGMGRAAAEALAADGARLAVVARDREGVEKAAAELEATHGVRVVGFAADAGREGALEVAVASAIATFGRVDGYATTVGPIGTRLPFAELSSGDWEFEFQNSLMATVRGCRAILPHLIEHGGGTIVTTAAYSIRAQKPTLVHYSALKSAVASMTKNIALTYGRAGVRANCVCPGLVETDMLPIDRDAAAAEYGVTPEEALNVLAEKKWNMKLALGRAGQPREVGELIAFLLSGRAAYLTGATINIDGGTDF